MESPAPSPIAPGAAAAHVVTVIPDALAGRETDPADRPGVSSHRLRHLSLTAPLNRLQRHIFEDADLEADLLGAVADKVQVREDGMYAQWGAAATPAATTTARVAGFISWWRLPTAVLPLWLFLTQYVVATAPRLFVATRRQHWVRRQLTAVPEIPAHCHVAVRQAEDFRPSSVKLA